MDGLLFFLPATPVSIPERVVEALKPRESDRLITKRRVSIPERVLEALKRLGLPAVPNFLWFQSLKGF